MYLELWYFSSRIPVGAAGSAQKFIKIFIVLLNEGVQHMGKEQKKRKDVKKKPQKTAKEKKAAKRDKKRGS